jgi:CRP-like cAMP-binding protein
MHDFLIKYINSYASTLLADSEMDLIRNTFLPKRFRKRQYFLQEGKVCKYGAFIVKGAMRQYSVDDKGTEHIIRLSIENWWVVDRESFVMLTPSVYNIDAWEDTEALIITKADIMNLINQIPSIAQMIRKLDEKHSIADQRRLNASISLSAEKRYYDFVSCYPEFLQRFPQHIIASYLGITKETLSRIRRQVEKK